MQILVAKMKYSPECKIVVWLCLEALQRRSLLVDDLRLLLVREIDSNRGWQSIRIFLEEWQERRNGQGDPAFILEPDLEYSAGSLGELNRIRWAGYLLNGGDALSEMDSLEPDRSSALGEAESFLRLRLERERPLFLLAELESRRSLSAPSAGFESSGGGLPFRSPSAAAYSTSLSRLKVPTVTCLCFHPLFTSKQDF